MAVKTFRQKCFGWRSSTLFIVTVVSVAMFSDMFLFSFIIPLLPDILEQRLRLPASKTQFFTSVILSMNALVSIVIAPFTAHLADRLSSKNRLMVFSWLVNVIGTVFTAWSTHFSGLLLGRLIQTIAGSLAWITGMAIMGETVGTKHMAKAFGFTSLFLSAGLLCGPAISGLLYDLVPYSVTWSSAFAVLGLGVLLQLLVDERPKLEKEVTGKDCRVPDDETIASSEDTQSNERLAEISPLLLPSTLASCQYQSISNCGSSTTTLPDKQQQPPTKSVYGMMLRNRRVVTALIADILFIMTIASFDTTIPIHIKKVFHWKTLQAGLLFLLLQLPSMILVVPAGWVKDRIGMRLPVTIGFILLAPSLWLLGVPGENGFKWADGQAGQDIYIGALLATGVCRTLMLGFGGVEVMQGATDLATRYPQIIGENGVYSRAFSMSNISYKLGMFLGPLLSGGLTDAVGYYYMNVFFGILCLVMGIATFVAIPA